MAIFRVITSLAITVKMTKMAIVAVMEYYELALNMVFMGVFLKKSKNPDQTWKQFVNWSNDFKVMAKTKNFSDYRPFPLYLGQYLNFFLVAHLQLLNGIRLLLKLLLQLLFFWDTLPPLPIDTCSNLTSILQTPSPFFRQCQCFSKKLCEQ